MLKGVRHMLYKKKTIRYIFKKIGIIYKTKGLKGVIEKILNRYSFWGWRRDYRKFYRYYRLRLYKEALNLEKTITVHNLDNAYFYQALAVSHWFIGNTESAKQYLFTSLNIQLRPDMDINNIIKTIQQAIDPKIELITSEYNFIGGEANLGFIEHIYDSKQGETRYITKIIDNETARKEKIFYSNIQSNYALLKKHTPIVIHIFEIKGFSFITIKKIIGRHPEAVRTCDIVDLIKKIEVLGVSADKYINNINYNDIKLKCEIGFPFNGFYGVFATIHTEASNKQIFRWLKKRMHFLRCSPEVYKLISRLETVILKQKLYQEIIPAKNYGFLHNDLHSENIIIDNYDQSCYIIDWDRYGMGPRGYDLIMIFRDYNVPFKRIKEIYLDDIDNNRNTIINKIFFIYPLIVSYFPWPNNSDMDDLIDDYLKPAVEFIEYLVEKLRCIES